MLNQPGMLGQSTPDGNPVAAISDIGQTVAGQNIALDAKASFDPSNVSNPLSFAWNFGDGVTANGISVNHTYRQVGSFVLTLTVTSPGGKRVISKTIKVGNGPEYYSNPYSPLPGVNRYNTAVTIATANNSLPAQPPLQPPLLSTPTPAPVPTVTAIPTTGVTATSAVTVTPSTVDSGAGSAPIPLILGMLAGVVLLIALTLIAVALLRTRKG